MTTRTARGVITKALVYTLVGSLAASGLVGVIALTSSSFDATTIRVLITTASLAFYGMTALCCNAHLGRPLAPIGVIGMIVAGAGAVYALATTWFTPEDWWFLRLRGAFFFVSLAFAHASLLLLINLKSGVVKACVGVALGANVLFTVLATAGVLSADIDESALRGLGALMIIGVVASIAAAVLARLR